MPIRMGMSIYFRLGFLINREIIESLVLSVSID